MISEAPRFTMYVDPANRERAYSTVHGAQNSFVGGGDMYAMTLGYATYLSRGALEYIRHGCVVPLSTRLHGWSAERWLKDLRDFDDENS